MRLSRLTSVALVAALALPSFASAQIETLRLDGLININADQVNGRFTGGVHVSRAPFGTPATTFDMFCIDDDNPASVGQTWTVHYITFAQAITGGTFHTQAIRQLGDDPSWGITELREAAYLSTKFASTPITQWDDIHGAIWSLFSKSITRTGAMDAQLALAVTNANASYDSYVLALDQKVFAADWATNPQAISQGFITDGGNVTTTAVTPEPSTYALFAAGLVAIGFARRRRRAA